MSKLVRRATSHYLLVGIGIAVLLLLITLVLAASPIGARWNGDLELFYVHAGAFINGFVSQTPFLSWYPPFALVPITLPALLAPNLPLYTFLFTLEMSIAAGVLTVVVGRTASITLPKGSAGRAVAWLMGLILLTAVFLPWRYDVVPALATAAGMFAIATGAPVVAGAFIGLGAALKLWPAVLVPTILAWYWLRGEARSVWRLTAGFAVVVSVGFGIYVLFPPASPIDLLRFQGGRPLQLETAPASIVGLLAAIGITQRPEVTFSDFSYNVLGPAAQTGLQVLSIAEPVLLLVALIAAGSCYFKTRRDSTLDFVPLAMGLTAATLALLLGNRVFSPQYVIWLLPLIPFLPKVYRVTAAAGFALTAVIFPFMYDRLIAMEAVPELVLVARNTVLAGLWLAVVIWLARAAAPPPREIAHA